MTNKARLVALLAITALAITACTARPTASPTPTATPKVYVYSPLTGAKYEAGSNPALDGPSVACKIDNLGVARPQISLNQTDIVFDELVEGGLTRLVAVWHSRLPEQVGPVRSIRPMDPDIVSQFGGIVCYSGGQRKFVKLMQATNVFNASETEEDGKGTFSRAPDRESPHNVIVNVAKLQQAHAELAPPQKGFFFAANASGATAAEGGIAVDNFKVYFPNALAEWAPSADGTRWLRTQDGEPHLDIVDSKQISAKNVVVMQVKIDRQYGNVPKTTMVGTGKAWVFTGGNYVEATWSKASQTAPIFLRDAAGQEILLARGNTWIELMPMDPEGSLKIAKSAIQPTPTPKRTIY